MLASHDVFSHTGLPTAKIKKGGGGGWFVAIASHNARFLTGVTILHHTATGVLFLLAVLLFVCLLLECRIEGTVGLHYWLLCAEERISQGGVHGDH